MLDEGASATEVSEPIQCLNPFCPMNKIQGLCADGPGNLMVNQVQWDFSFACLASYEWFLLDF